MNNFYINRFYKKILEIINTSELPVGTAYFILKDILNELEKIYYQAVENDKNAKEELKIQRVEIPQPFEELEQEE